MPTTLRRFALLCVLVPALFATGCISYTTLHTARSVDEGETQVVLAPGVFGLDTGDDNAFLPTTEVAVRHGFSENFDLGFKLFPLGLAVDGNYTVINEESFALSVDPYLSFTGISSNGATFVWGTALLNILADVVSTDVITVTLGLKPGALFVTGSADGETDAVSGGVIGGMAGVKIQATEGFALMPSVDLLVPFEGGGVLYSGGVAFIF